MTDVRDGGHDLFDIPWPRVLVTGGGSGIGRSTALALAERGVTTFVCGRRAAPLDETVALAEGAPGSVRAIVADTTDVASVERMFATIEADGPIQGLVHGAAQVTLGPMAEMTADEFVATVQSTLIGGFNVVQRFGRALLAERSPGAAVLLTSSTCVSGSPGIAHSAAGKAGLTSMARSLGREWGPDGIRVNCVGPGAFPIEKSEAMFADPDVKSYQSEQIALGRYGVLSEIVGPVLFLLSRSSAYVTGQSLVVDGGQTLGAWPIPKDVLVRGLNNRYDGR